MRSAGSGSRPGSGLPAVPLAMGLPTGDYLSWYCLAFWTAAEGLMKMWSPGKAVGTLPIKGH